MGQSLSDNVHKSQPLKSEGRQPGWNQGPSSYQPSGLRWAKTIHVTRSKHVKGLKARYLLGQNTTCEFSGYSPLSSYKTTLKQQLNGEKRWKMRWRAKRLICFGVELCCFPVQEKLLWTLSCYFKNCSDRRHIGSNMMMKWCLMSSDVGWHIRDKLRPMPKHGSINLYVHGSQKAR